MELEKATISFSTIIPTAIALGTCIWALIKIIFNNHKKDFETHKQECKSFRNMQYKENEVNSNFRSRYEKLDNDIEKKMDDMKTEFRFGFEKMGKTLDLILNKLLDK